MAGVFKRTEKKYLLDPEKKKEFLNSLGDRAVPDIYGAYTISNIYLDTEDNELIRNSLDKPVYKEKLRLRSYLTPKAEDTVFLEMKKKWLGTVYKRRVELSYGEATAYLEKEIYPEARDCQILREIDYMIKYYRLRPDTFMAYDRRAYVVKEDEDIRFTIDERIRSRKTELKLDKGDAGRELLPSGMALLEIKAPGALPLWFTDILSELKIYSGSFSKYGKSYLRDVEERLLVESAMGEKGSAVA
ncbi:MAG: polyphosphate polymerase domain-containing protein [Lachnospiraceae bacterium]|nr:polyphosphate polymerase domain-containing protein [Lachnospiraceae bacterium]